MRILQILRFLNCLFQNLVSQVEDLGKRRVDSIVEISDTLNDLLTEIRSPAAKSIQDSTKAILEKHNQ